MEKTEEEKAQDAEFSRLVKEAGKRAVERARQTARKHGTELWFIRDGKIVSEKP